MSFIVHTKAPEIVLYPSPFNMEKSFILSSQKSQISAVTNFEIWNRLDFLDCKSFTLDIKSKIVKASQAKASSLAARGYSVSSYQEKLQSKTQRVYGTG